MSSMDEITTALRTAFPGWNIWRSDEGRWWATRHGPLPPSRRPDDYALTVTADTPRLLTTGITRQPDYATVNVTGAPGQVPGNASKYGSADHG